VSDGTRRTTNDFRGATIDRSAIGDQARVTNISYGPDGVGPLADLRSRLAAIRGDLVQAEPDPGRRAELGRLIDRLDEAAGVEIPDVEVVHSRWERIKAMLAPGLAVAANVAQISSLVNDLVSG
jgi:hypothetical protein